MDQNNQQQANISPLLKQYMNKYKGRFEAWEHKDDNLQLFCAYYPAGTIIEEHSHETDNCGVIIQGQMFISVDGVEKVYNVGDWYEIKAGVKHSARTEILTTEVEFWFTVKDMINGSN